MIVVELSPNAERDFVTRILRLQLFASMAESIRAEPDQFERHARTRAALDAFSVHDDFDPVEFARACGYGVRI